MERLVIAIIIGVILIQVVEASVSESAANWLIFVVLAGAAVYRRDGLTKFSEDVQSRLA